MCSYEYFGSRYVLKRDYVGSTKRGPRHTWVGCCDREARERMSLEDYEFWKMLKNRYLRVV